MSHDLRARAAYALEEQRRNTAQQFGLKLRNSFDLEVDLDDIETSNWGRSASIVIDDVKLEYSAGSVYVNKRTVENLADVGVELQRADH